LLDDGNLGHHPDVPQGAKGRSCVGVRRLIVPSDEPMKARPERPCVLLVDDYQDARLMYTEYLKYSGFEVVEAANGVEALRQALDSMPDIILMDLSLPVMDGWEATRRLKADARTARIPVVAFTGHVFASTSDRAKQAGCDAFVTKPCLPEELVTEIRKVLRHHAR
jgi:two-component system cell cycle response regulator DivK